MPLSSRCVLYIQAQWQRRGWWYGLMQPFAWLVALLLRWRPQPKPQPLPLPVVVVGNLNVGGSGKTPLVRALALAAQARGWRVGLISRGTGGNHREPHAVRASDSPRSVGDEPYWLFEQLNMPLWVGRERQQVAQALIQAQPEINLIVADDGLQHRQLWRQMEVLICHQHSWGNGALLPAGPLREPLSRMDEVDLIVAVGPPPPLNGRAFHQAHVRHGASYALHAPETKRHWAAGQRVHAVTAIAHPQRFFDMLRAHPLDVLAHPWPDHHHFQAEQLRFDDDVPVLITEKDAVKCRGLGLPLWVVPLELVLPDAFFEEFFQCLSKPNC